MSQYDSIIIGAGHNGLVCAAYLARSGQRVLVLEASATPGGLAASREFHPGFRAPVAHSFSHFSRQVADDLKLDAQGFAAGENAMPLIGIAQGRDPVVVNEASVAGTGEADAAAFQSLRARLLRYASALEPFWLKTIPGIGSSSLSDMLTYAHMGAEHPPASANGTWKSFFASHRCRCAT